MDLIAGPWVGEFGWELMSWQAHVRDKARRGKYEHITVLGPPGHAPLYSDFADVYVPVTLNGTKDCWRTEDVNRRDRLQVNGLVDRLINGNTHSLVPEGLVPIEAQYFLAFGDGRKVPPDKRFDVLVHVRQPINKRKSHAWHPVHAEMVIEKLVERGLTVAAIGTQAECPMGAIDRRNLPLDKLVDLMAATGVVIGPSSGPMHLASLCCTPHVVWTDKQWYSAIRGTNKKRYESFWNPFRTPCIVLEEGWQPNPDLIALKTEEALRRWRP